MLSSKGIVEAIASTEMFITAPHGILPVTNMAPPHLDFETIRSSLKQFQRDTGWFYANRETLRKRYANKFVAVYQQKVVGSGADLEKLIAHLQGEYGNAVGHFAIEYLTDKDIPMILAAA